MPPRNHWTDEAARQLVGGYRRTGRLTDAQATEVDGIIDSGATGLILQLLSELSSGRYRDII